MAAPLDFSSQVFTIFHDQLGLQLRAAKGLVESLVIDHVERPCRQLFLCCRQTGSNPIISGLPVIQEQSSKL